MKKWTTLLLITILPFALSANEVLPPTESTPSTEVVTPSWAVDPIGPPYSKKEPSPEMMQAKHAAAVAIGTAAMIIIGLLVTSSNTGKHALPSSH